MSTVKADNFTWKTGQATGQPGTNVTGDQIVYGVCKAWISINGVSPISTRAAFNFSSVTRNAGGDYTFTFTNVMVDVNYSVSGTGGQGAAGQQTGQMGVWNSAPTASSFRAGYVYNGVTAYDIDWIYAQVHR